MDNGSSCNRDRALIVDLDGSLISGDTLWESVFRLVASRPHMIFMLLFWLLRGRSQFKKRLSQSIAIDPVTFCYRKDVLDFIRQEQGAGRRLILATAADSVIARSVADHLGIFNDIIASDGRRNLKGAEKLRDIKALIGDNNFDYIGGSSADLVVWRAAGRSIVVGSEQLVISAEANGAPLLKRFSVERPDIRTWMRALRIHQWVKNILIFVPLMLAHQATNIDKLSLAGVAFLTFGLCASATYIWNDLLDLPSDRLHPTKRRRPIASGRIPILDAVLVSIVLISASVAISCLVLPLQFLGVLLLYVIVTVTYSLFLKKKLMIDVIVLGGLFALRLFIGSVAVNVVISEWLFAFAIFFFLSLAFVKRYSDLAQMPLGNNEKLGGRGYYAHDLELVRVMGPVSGYIAVLIVILYVNSPNVTKLYSNPHWLWMVALCSLYWISRVWFLAHRGQMPDDPVVFALGDQNSRLVGVACVAFVLLATFT